MQWNHTSCSSLRQLGKLINAILLPQSEEEMLYDNWGLGSESYESDACPDCGELGVLQDPVAPNYNNAPHTANCHKTLDPKQACVCSGQ